MKNVLFRWAPVFVLVAAGWQPSRGTADDITINVRSLEGNTIEQENTDRTKKDPNAVLAVVQVTVRSADRDTKGQLVFAKPKPIVNGDNVKISLPADVKGVRLDIVDINGILLTAVVDAVLNTTQVITVVMPKKDAVDMVCCPTPCCSTHRGFLRRR